MGHYQLLTTSHREKDGRLYHVGDIIEAPHDLVSMFGSSKFRRLSDKEVMALQSAGEGVASPDEPGADEAAEPRRRRAKVKRHKVLNAER